MSKWYQGVGNNSDVVISSKVSLFRNFSDIPFPNRMNPEHRKTVNKRAFALIKNSPYAKEFDLITLDSSDASKSLSYAEKLLISDDFANSNNSFLLSKDESVSISLCDENHLKISSFSAGESLEQAYKVANDIDDIFIKNYQIAYNDKLGFLTSSPMNLGTGMCASFILNLQGLESKNSVKRLASLVSKLGVSLTELYTNGAGALYVLSNEITLGISEKGTIDNLNAICNQIIKQERNARENLKNDTDFEDKIFRTLGILKLARKLNKEEFLNSLSLIRLGVSLGYFEYDYKVFGELLHNCFDANLIESSKTDLTESMCDALRAELVREALE